MNPYQWSKPSPVGQRSNGPAAVCSQSGVLCHLPKAAVVYPFCLRISETRAQLLGMEPV